MSPFDRFEKTLKLEARAGKCAPRRADPERRGRMKKSVAVPLGISVPGELAEQVEALASAFTLSRAGLVKIMLAAGTRALLSHLEECGGRLTIPLRMKVVKDPEAPPSQRRLSDDELASLSATYRRNC